MSESAQNLPIDIDPMSNQWLLDHAAETGDDPVVLIEGHPAAGFARVAANKLDLRLEPGICGELELDWRWYFDARMFGNRGEWHCWRIAGTHWRARFCQTKEWDGQQSFKREFVLWGTQCEQDGDWMRCWEKRGAVVWVPTSAHSAKDKPARLSIRQRVEYDEETGIAAVVDAMIVGFVGGAGE